MQERILLNGVRYAARTLLAAYPNKNEAGTHVIDENAWFTVVSSEPIHLQVNILGKTFGQKRVVELGGFASKPATEKSEGAPAVCADISARNEQNGGTLVENLTQGIVTSETDGTFDARCVTVVASDEARPTAFTPALAAPYGTVHNSDPVGEAKTREANRIYGERRTARRPVTKGAFGFSRRAN